MQVNTILFDLDGTLLPMDQEMFIKAYFKLLAAKVAPLGYEPKKLLDAVWGGTAAMVQNDGSCLNEEAFWRYFCGIYGENAMEHKPYFDEFYRNEFQQAQGSCGYNKEAAKLIRKLKDRRYRLAMATNPLFPRAATHSRIRWAGLELSDFEVCTTYENAHYCKPNLMYYREILDTLHVKAEECLMIGNDVSEDMIARRLGMKVFLLTDCLLNKHNEDIERYPHGGFEQLNAYIDALNG